MKLNTRGKLAALTVGLAMFAMNPTQATEYVTNGALTSSTGWSTTSTHYAFSATFGYLEGDTTPNAFLAQGILGATGPLTLQYDMLVTSLGPGFGGWGVAYWNADVIPGSVFSAPTETLKHFSFTVMGTGNDVLAFNSISSGEIFNVIRNVSITDARYTGGEVPIDRVPAIPEPETYAMMLAGLGVLGFVARRRNTKIVV